MPKKYVIKFLLLLASFLLVLKPIFGFQLYGRAKSLSRHEFITIIKAFSKRKQEYAYDADAQSEYVLQDPMRKAVRIVLSFLLFGYSRFLFLLRLTANLLYHFYYTFFPSIKLYLTQGKLTI